MFEAYDEPWKRRWEGTVGGYWGLLDGTERKLKYPAGADVSNHPFWKLQMVCGMILCTCVFAAAWLTRRGRPSPPRLAPWVAVAISATTGGILLGIGAEKMILESFGIGGWLVQGLLLSAGIVAPLLSANALIAGRALPSFLDVLGPSEGRSQSFMTNMLGIALIVTALIGVGNRAKPRVRRTLARFSVRHPDHGRGAVLRRGVAQPSGTRRAPARRGRVRRTVRRCFALHRLQRRASQLAVIVDLCGIPRARRDAMAATHRCGCRNGIECRNRRPW